MHVDPRVLIPLVMFTHPDWTNMFKEFRHLLHLRLLSQSCDVYCAVLRVILLFRTSCKYKKKQNSVKSSFITFLLTNCRAISMRTTLLTHVTLICTNGSCHPVIVKRTNGEKSVCETEAPPVEYYRDNPDTPSNTEPYWLVKMAPYCSPQFQVILGIEN